MSNVMVVESIRDVNLSGTVGKSFIVDTNQPAVEWQRPVHSAAFVCKSEGKEMTAWMDIGTSQLYVAPKTGNQMYPLIERWSTGHMTMFVKNEWPFLVVLAIGCVAIVYGGKWALKKLL